MHPRAGGPWSATAALGCYVFKHGTHQPIVRANYSNIRPNLKVGKKSILETNIIPQNVATNYFKVKFKTDLKKKNAIRFL